MVTFAKDESRLKVSVTGRCHCAWASFWFSKKCEQGLWVNLNLGKLLSFSKQFHVGTYRLRVNIYLWIRAKSVVLIMLEFLLPFSETKKLSFPQKLLVERNKYLYSDFLWNGKRKNGAELYKCKNGNSLLIPLYKSEDLQEISWNWIKTRIHFHFNNPKENTLHMQNLYSSLKIKSNKNP